MTDKRSISLPTPVNAWLTDEAQRRGMTVSALVAHLLMNIMRDDGRRR
jgi:macrodomain Ter protein organizer (MatP/YcbG family)